MARKSEITHLNKRQLSFLRCLNLNNCRKVSVHSLGKQYYHTERSIYMVLDKFLKAGLIDVFRGKKQLIVTMTALGHQIILDNT